MVGLGPGTNQRERTKLLIPGLQPFVSLSHPAGNRWHTQRGLTDVNVMKALHAEVWGGVRISARERGGAQRPGKSGAFSSPTAAGPRERMMLGEPGETQQETWPQSNSAKGQNQSGSV